MESLDTQRRLLGFYLLLSLLQGDWIRATVRCDYGQVHGEVMDFEGSNFL